MQPSTPAHRIPTWRSRLRRAYIILRIDAADIVSVLYVTHAIRDARLLLAPNILVTFTFDEIVNTLSHAGLPQLYFDHMCVIKRSILLAFRTHKSTKSSHLLPV